MNKIVVGFAAKGAKQDYVEGFFLPFHFFLRDLRDLRGRNPVWERRFDSFVTHTALRLVVAVDRGRHQKQSGQVGERQVDEPVIMTHMAA